MTSKITDFLLSSRPKDELRVALEVLREFKGHESRDEWLELPFIAWAKFEQLQEYLEHMVEGSPLRDDTLEYLSRPLEGGR